MAERSFTLFPDVDPPIKKLYALPAVLFVGASLVLNKPFRIPILVTLPF